MNHPYSNFTSQYGRFYRQVLQLYTKIDYPDNKYLRDVSNQRVIYDTLFAETALKHNLPIRYQFRVLKELLRRIENSIDDSDEDEISDQLMNTFSSLLTQSISNSQFGQGKFYVTYTLYNLSNGLSYQETARNLSNVSSKYIDSISLLPTITIFESYDVLAAGGTTGFRTWEAALHMGNYLCTYPEIVRAKHILELGSGTAYISILCALHLQACHVLTTDGSMSVTSTHNHNFDINGLQYPNQIRSEQLIWKQNLSDAKQFPEFHNNNKIDLILATDVIYDSAGISALLVTISDLFSLFPDVKVLIASTVRNEETIRMFLDNCNKKKWLVLEIDWKMKFENFQEGPFFDITVPIKIISIVKQY
ncbi:Protein-lysine N-methyltransferase EFM3 [Erysiphe neolycopersici]|uniref:Protein-lysine N-methyltransferase EFM3 n=1 Tax=Erysiphe neolycopersici TaxID=212602 RepID=A0A420HT47_9PEZI|nr:Protein-lysine N-methyltransferase EFM3 [Erysiphe neolycopersici]